MTGAEPRASVDLPATPEPAVEEPTVSAPQVAEPEPARAAPQPEPERATEPPMRPTIAAQPSAMAAPPMTREPARVTAPAPHHESRGRADSIEPAVTREPAAHQEPIERGASTAPQLRRFIKSRAYVPMHELRRRFGINGNDDDVTTIDLERGRIYVGLPGPEGRLLGELLRSGDIGYELSMDPMSPIVVGVYPMRPVPRP